MCTRVKCTKPKQIQIVLKRFTHRLTLKHVTVTAKEATVMRRMWEVEVHRVVLIFSECIEYIRMESIRWRYDHDRCESIVIKWRLWRRKSILLWSHRRTIPSTMNTRHGILMTVRLYHVPMSIQTLSTRDALISVNSDSTLLTYGLSRMISSLPNHEEIDRHWVRRVIAIIGEWTVPREISPSVCSERVLPLGREPFGAPLAIERLWKSQVE